jgi:hypothetical protein
VHGLHAQTVTELLRENVRALMLARDDWFFAFGGAALLCVCRGGYRSPDDVAGRLAELTGMADALPPPSAQQGAAQPIILSGGPGPHRGLGSGTRSRAARPAAAVA